MEKVYAPTFWDILTRSLLAGLVAGAILAIFHLAFTEPVIDMAIGYESALGGMSAPDAPAPTHADVSRSVQRVGLVVGFVAYGVFLGALFGAAYYVSRRLRVIDGAKGNGAVMGAMAYWAVALIPFLRYPANPPAVGDPESIGQRQALFLSVMGLALVGVALTLAMKALLSSRGALAGRQPLQWAVCLAGYGLYSLGLYLAMPPNPDSIPIPMDVVTSFRALSMIGLTIFWATMTAVFLWMQRRERQGIASLAQGTL
ncbi:MAG: hypothetical protein HW403_48 [Dehalococcoidia bacterium]|nr:hypothetical protein [Dehalococcoidia bacterium]